jgi:bacterioferritin (cytochrome b1)
MADNKAITRDRLAELLNEDLAREYQAIIAYVVYSQVLKGAEYMNIADQLETHAQQELQHALIISRQIDYLGKMPTVSPKQVKISEDPKEMLKFTWTMRMKRFGITANEFDSVKQLANLHWRSRYGRFLYKSKITKTI